MKKFVYALLLLIGTACAQERFKICASEDIKERECNSLQISRSESQVSCIPVTDSAECAIQLADGKTDFGIFSAEEMLLAYQFYPDHLQPIAQLRHPDRLDEDFEFQVVAVVPASFDSWNGLEGLKGGGFCHPGFIETQVWNDLILKNFEKKVYEHHCNDGLSTSENEAANLKNFFGNACRPGPWVFDRSVDRTLKSKYPELCALCDDKSSCEYRNVSHHGHFGALDCLVSGRGKVAYVAYEYVKKYFSLNGTSISVMSVPVGFQFLCPDGTTRPLTSTNPCAWVKQPWNAILARKEKAPQLTDRLKNWLTSSTGAHDWTSTLNTIIQKDAKAIYFSRETNLKTYLANGRNVELPKSNCGKTIRWCTVNVLETKKCNWVATEALALGVEPSITCDMRNSTFQCLRDIAAGNSDIITIDSNYGYIARQVFNLTTMMYTQTDILKNSEVIAVVVDGSPLKISSFKDLKNERACFPEYGGIAWLSFLHTLRTAKIITDDCDYSKIVSKFLSAACTPGAKDADHSIGHMSPEASAILCSLCPVEMNNDTCSAMENNYYYGDKGALECVRSGAGNVAFVEAKNLKGTINGKVINPNEYRVICKNGSLATYTGFDVDEHCALSVTIDSEVVGRKSNNDVFVTDATLALLKMQHWLGYDPSLRRPIRIYDSFRSGSDLLFKDSTIGLAPISSDIKAILAYKELFSHVESCSSVGTILANVFTVFLTVLTSLALFRLDNF